MQFYKSSSNNKDALRDGADDKNWERIVEIDHPESSCPQNLTDKYLQRHAIDINGTVSSACV
jgi:hypothetical protein